MAARKYEVPVCTGCGIAVSWCSCKGGVTSKTVTATDDRYVKPLIKAARGVQRVAREMDGLERVSPDWILERLEAALAPFEEGS